MRQFFKFFLASCLGTIAALVVLGILFAGIGSMMAISSGAGSGIDKDQILHVKINDMIPEKTNNVANPEFSFSPKKVLGIRDIAETIKRAGEDDRIKGMFLDVNYSSPGQASSLVIKRAIDSFKLSGKWVYAYADGYSQGGYFLASHADSVYLNPNGSIDFRGFAMFIPFVTELMDKIGLDFEIYYAGDFKSATEPFRRESMSDQNRLQMKTYINEIYDLYLSDIARSRGKTVEELRDIADNFKIRYAEDALEYGMADALLTRQDVYKMMNEKAGIDRDKKTPLLSLDKYFENLKPKKNYGAKDKIAVVYAEGEINDSQEKMNGVIQGDKYAKLLRKIKNDDKIKAVVLRVNSPGGSVLASSKILHELKLIKDAGKGLVVSMGDYAASGGYYISSHADWILAEPNTLTGSIGVYSMIPALDRMFNDKIGIHFDSVATGKYSARFTPYFDWDEREDEFMQATTDREYEKFLNIVAEGRGMTKEKVHEIAQGRIWSGNKAKQLGLVDEIGDLDRAIDVAAENGELEEYRIVEYPFVKDQFTLLLEELTGEELSSAKVRKAMLKEELGEWGYYLDMLSRLKEQEGAQARLPFEFIYN